MSTPYMTGPHLSLHQFHTFPTEKVRYFPTHPVVDINEPVGAVPRWGVLATMQPGQTAVQAFSGRMGVFPEQAPRAVVQASSICGVLSD